MTNLQIAEKIELALNMLRTGKRISANDVLTDVVSELKRSETELVAPVVSDRVQHNTKLKETKAIILELFRDDYLCVGTCERCEGAGWFEAQGCACETCHGTGYEIREGYNHD